MLKPTGPEGSTTSLHKWKSVLSEINSLKKINKDIFFQRNLLLGNGASIAVSDTFNYKTLYNIAKGTMPPSLRSLFKHFDTYNFEEIMRYLETSKQIVTELDETKNVSNDVSNQVTSVIDKIRRQLIAVLEEHHPSSPKDCSASYTWREKACMFLFNGEIDCLYTLNYDWLTYWATSRIIEFSYCGYPLFLDFFTDKNIERPESCLLPFDSDKAKDEFVTNESNKMFWLHGSRLLVHDEKSGNTCKICKSSHSNLEEASKHFPEKLFVAEGLSNQKMEKIKSNDYLRLVFDFFSNCKGIMITYGFSFSDGDEHIIEALLKNKNLTKLYVGIIGKKERARIAIQIDKIRENIDPTLRNDIEHATYFDSRSDDCWIYPDDPSF